jgi:hypothetical protein
MSDEQSKAVWDAIGKHVGSISETPTTTPTDGPEIEVEAERGDDILIAGGTVHIPASMLLGAGGGGVTVTTNYSVTIAVAPPTAPAEPEPKPAPRYLGSKGR